MTDEDTVDSPADDAMAAFSRPLKTLRSDAPQLRGDVAYVLDRASHEQAVAARLLNERGSVGLLELRSNHSKLRARRDQAEFELAYFERENPLLAGGPAPGAGKAWSVVVLALLLLAAVGVVAVTRPTLARKEPTPEAGEAAPPEPDRQGRAARGPYTRVYGGRR